MVKRGEVYLIKFPFVLDPSRKPPIDKWVVVLQGGDIFTYSDNVAVVLMTSQNLSREYPFDVFVSKSITRRKDSRIQCDSPFTVPRDVIKKGTLLFNLPPEIMNQVDEALMLGLGIVGMDDLEAQPEVAVGDDDFDLPF